MSVHNDPNSVCMTIHNLIQTSGLHFIINQTPWSSYITIRKKFIGRGAVASNLCNDETKMFIDQIKSLEKKLENLELELASMGEDNKESANKLDLKIKALEAECVAHEQEKQVKDEIIKNLNAGFRDKVNDLNAKIDSLEADKKVLIKKEKKTFKKLRQKSQKAENDGIELYDCNKNLLDYSIMQQAVVVQDDSVCEVAQPEGLESSLPHLTLASTGSHSPVRVPHIPSTPPTSYTPPGLPPLQTQEQPIKTLSAYFAEPASDVIEDSFETEHVDMKEYVDNINKISLIPQLRRRKEGTDSG